MKIRRVAENTSKKTTAHRNNKQRNGEYMKDNTEYKRTSENNNKKTDRGNYNNQLRTFFTRLADTIRR